MNTNRTAEENGWVLEAHEEEDSKQQTEDNLVTGTNVTSKGPWISG
jgi:hypothetical protein